MTEKERWNKLGYSLWISSKNGCYIKYKGEDLLSLTVTEDNWLIYCKKHHTSTRLNKLKRI